MSVLSLELKVGQSSEARPFGAYYIPPGPTKIREREYSPKKVYLIPECLFDKYLYICSNYTFPFLRVINAVLFNLNDYCAWLHEYNKLNRLVWAQTLEKKKRWRMKKKKKIIRRWRKVVDLILTHTTHT